MDVQAERQELTEAALASVKSEIEWLVGELANHSQRMDRICANLLIGSVPTGDDYDLALEVIADKRGCPELGPWEAAKIKASYFIASIQCREIMYLINSGAPPEKITELDTYYFLDL